MREIRNHGLRASIFFGVQQGSLLLDRKKKNGLGFFGSSWRTLRELGNFKCSWYKWCFFNITRFTNNQMWFLKQHGNWRAKLICSFTNIFCRVDDNLSQLHLMKYNIFNCATYLAHGSFPIMGFIIMPIDQQSATVGGNKLKDEARHIHHFKE